MSEGSGLVYLAGPMTGHPQFNFPKFREAAVQLRELGFAVVNPAELDDPKSVEAAMASEWGDPEEYHAITNLSWADFLSRDVKLIAEGGFDFVICLPGWEASRGARLETFVANLCGITIMILKDNGGSIEPISIRELARVWAGGQA